MEQKENNTQETARKGCLVRMGGQPPVGDNTTIMLHMVSMAAMKDRTPAAYFSPGNMTNVQVVNRLIAINSGVDHKDIEAGMLSDEDWKKLAASLPTLLGDPLYVDDTPEITLGDLSAKIADLANDKGVRLVVVNPVSMVMGDGEKFDDAQDRTDHVTAGLKTIAEELGITIFAVEE